MLFHGLQQGQWGCEIVAVIFQRFGDGLTHQGIGRKMEHGFDLMLGKDFFQNIHIRQVSLHKGHSRRNERFTMPQLQGIQNHNPLTGLRQQPRGM